MYSHDGKFCLPSRNGLTILVTWPLLNFVVYQLCGTLTHMQSPNWWELCPGPEDVVTMPTPFTWNLYRYLTLNSAIRCELSSFGVTLCQQTASWMGQCALWTQFTSLYSDIILLWHSWHTCNRIPGLFPTRVQKLWSPCFAEGCVIVCMELVPCGKA